jgi:hypothetical protein
MNTWVDCGAIRMACQLSVLSLALVLVPWLVSTSLPGR